MTKIKFISLITIFLTFLLSCNNSNVEKKNLIYKENICVENGIGHEYFEVYEGDKLIIKKDDIRNFKVKDTDCFAIFYNFPEPFFGYYIENGKIKKKVSGIYPTNLITADLKYVISWNNEKTSLNGTINVKEIKSGKTKKCWKIDELCKNIPYKKSVGDCNLKENGNKVSIEFTDGWNETYESFELDEESLELIHIPTEYSKNNPENTKDLPYLH